MLDDIDSNWLGLNFFSMFMCLYICSLCLCLSCVCLPAEIVAIYKLKLDVDAQIRRQVNIFYADFQGPNTSRRLVYSHFSSVKSRKSVGISARTWWL